MNGLSLLVALAAVGVDVGWESTSAGKLAYTIRIETVLVDKLSEGSAIESVVEKSDRGLRKFRVAVGPKNPQTERVAAATANEVDYGWRPNETKGIDYYVQISRERLETLARGIPLECEVHPDVPEIEKIYVFVGDSKLPRELPQGTRSSATPPRDLSSYGDPRGGNVAPASGTDTNPAAPRYGSTGYGTQGNTPVNASDPNRNNGYGTQPPQGNLGNNQSPQGNLSNNQTYGPPTYGSPTYNPTTYGQDPSNPANRYGQYDNTLPVPPLDNNRPVDYNRNQYAPPQQDQYGRPLQQPTYAPPLAQTAALPPQQQYLSPPAAQTMPVGLQQPNPSAGAAPNPTMDALAAVLALQQKQLEQKQL
ncbi:MAG: hypothetical protein ABI614_24965, partial [Planctomycetota bacterium]